MSNEALHDIVKDLQEKQGIRVEGFQFVSGGCINSTVKLTCGVKNYFLKWNDGNRYPAMFQTEKMGLELLASTKTIKIPQVMALGEAAGQSYLMLEYIKTSDRSDVAWEKFGGQLAYMHQHSHEKFGLEIDNYIGSLKQSNRQHSNWIDFFCAERLEAQVKLGKDTGKVRQEIARGFKILYKRLPDLIPEQKEPALLHGDLWGGNLLMDERGETFIFDPAVYYGHREAELAYTRLFDRFPDSFYRGYEEVYPLEKGWQQRADLFNLYPLLVHVNLFGGGYLSQVQSILHKWAK